MIARSLRILCEGLIDYSGFAPPAALPLAQAVANYGAYRGQSHSWLLGRSIVPIAKIPEYEKALTAIDHEGKPWKLSALTTGHVLSDMEAIREFNERQENRAVIDAVELKADSADVICALRPTVPANLKVYVEIPLGGDLPALVAALAANGLRAKARTGGLTADAIPSVEAVAKFIVACRAARIPFKFTAGMHAPLRSARALTYAKDSPKTMMHGFINAFLAAGAAWQDADLHTVTEILGETSSEVFDFDEERALWRDVRVSCEFLEAIRRGFAISLGSCSFTEPVEGLQKFGWI